MFKALLRALVLIALLGVLLPAAAQDTSQAQPFYRILPLREGVSSDGCRFDLEYLISNNGTGSTQPVAVELRALNQPATVLASQPVAPLDAGRGSTIILSAPTTGFTPNTSQTFEVRITLNGGLAFGSQPRQLTLSIPATTADCNPPPAAANPLYIDFLNYTVDLDNLKREEILIGALVLVLVLVLLLVLMRLYRLIFRRPPAFGNHLPPYATTPPIDPYSQSGIRQSWQPYAQNNTITQPAVRGTSAVVKLLQGADGQYLSGWTITALRMSQYDQYGRVARTYTPGPLWVVRRLNRLAHTSKPLDADQVERKVTPLARTLTRQLLRRITQRSAVLPVALDLRLRGQHGEVSIVFELYQSDGANWLLLDRWQPEMAVTGKTIWETYTYTVHGQSGGETFRDFRQRLPLDLTRLLSELIMPRMQQTPQRQSAQPSPQMPTQPVEPSDDGPTSPETPDAPFRPASPHNPPGRTSKG
ncbi:MAG: hypothetical protein IPM16_13435 [Chloroflexi bacterium]|nr:hypothetical protein [Chloroflexota bacterium]